MFPTKFDLNTADGNDERAESPGNETEMRIACHTIMVGTYSYKPVNKVRISSEGVSIVAPRLTGPAEVTIHIPLKSFVHVLAHTEHPAAILLYTEAKTGERVRGALGMQPDAGPYFDPLSTEDSCKRIALLPLSLSRRRAGALRTLFGMVLDELDGLDARVADVLDALRADHSCDLDGERPGSALQPSGPAGPAPIADSPPPPDEASSSSSVIFPPSPSPISLSSHSSPSPKSSPTRKRKGRHKKNKSKKMKYVLVKNPEPNDVDAFLAGVAPILKGLSPLFLNLAKSEIISAALKYEMKMLTENCNGVVKE